MTTIVRNRALRDRSRAADSTGYGDDAPKAPSSSPSPESPQSPSPSASRSFRDEMTHSEFFRNAQIGLRSVFGGLLGDRTLARGGARLDLL